MVFNYERNIFFFQTGREILNAKGKILLGKCSRLKIAIDIDTYDMYKCIVELSRELLYRAKWTANVLTVVKTNNEKTEFMER